MVLVWGPELLFTESNSQVYRFLGSEKYQPVLTNIYAGLGIPPTLTGMASTGGGFTNNYISLKTLVERLEYGRGVLSDFWNQEIEIVQKASRRDRPTEPLIFEKHVDCTNGVDFPPLDVSETTIPALTSVIALKPRATLFVAVVA